MIRYGTSLLLSRVSQRGDGLILRRQQSEGEPRQVSREKSLRLC